MPGGGRRGGTDQGAAAHPPAARLRERTAELERAVAAIRAAQAGQGHTLVITGVPGAGKTRLLGAIGALAASSGLLVLRTAGGELERRLPFGCAVELLGPPAQAILDAAEADPGAAGAGDQMRLVRALHGSVAEAAQRTPLALIIDDVHWVDEPSLKLLAYLARRTSDLPLMLVLGMRPGTSSAAPELAEALALSASAVLMEPAPLSRRAVGALLTELLPAPPHDAVVRACEQDTGGNPLLLVELARTLVAEELGAEAGHAERVREIGPQAVSWSVRRTLRELGATAKALAETLAVLESTEDLDLLLELAAVAQTEAVSVLGELEAADLISTGEVLRVAHPIIRRVLLDDLPAAAVGLMRRQAARELHRRGRIDAAAAQLMSAPGGGTDWAIDTLLAAAGQARRRASPAEANRLLERALREPPPGPRRLEVLKALGEAQAAAGDRAAADTFASALELATEPEARAELLLASAWAHQAAGRFGEAVLASALGLEEEPVSDRVRTELAAMHDAAVLWSPDHPPEAAQALDPDTSREKAGDAQAQRIAHADAARRLMFIGETHWEPVVELARRAWDGGALLRHSTAENPALIRALTVLHNADLLGEALSLTEACLADARRRGLVDAEITWTHLRGHVHAYAGRLDESVHDLRVALRASAAGWGTWLPVTAAALVTVHLEQGEPAAAAAALATAHDAGTHPRQSPMWAVAQAARGRLALARGNAASALEDLLGSGRRAHEELGARSPALGPWRADAVLALHQLRRRDEARSLARVELDAARRWGAARALGAALRVSAAVEEDEAMREEMLGEAVRVTAAGEARLEHAHAMLAHGSEQRRAGSSEARALLQRAMDLAERCRASALADQAGRQLIAAGGRPRRRRLEGLEALTDGERRVARLAAGGLSNREIADELVVTPKAVAFHLGNVYRKLAITGRGELPASLAAATTQR